MNAHEKINYLEFPAKDIQATREFFQKVFGWKFMDYGPDYCAFSHAGINGGFFQSDACMTTKTGSALVVFYSKEIEKTQQKIEKAGGTIVKVLFMFPGGRRFHFADPSGNEFAVWPDK